MLPINVGIGDKSRVTVQSPIERRRGIARLRSFQQIETLRERLTVAQEKASAALDKAVALTEQIQSNVGQGDLLKSANSTVAAIDQISLATQPSPEETRAMLKKVLRDANIPPLT